MAVNNTLNFQAYLVATFKAIKEEPVIFILSGLLVSLLTIVSMGLLAGPLFGGYFLLFIGYLRDRRKPVFTDIFAGFQQFSTLLPYFLVLLLIFLGSLLLVLPGLLFATWWLYVLPLMADRIHDHAGVVRRGEPAQRNFAGFRIDGNLGHLSSECRNR